MTAATRVWVKNLHAPIPTYHTWNPGKRDKDGQYRTICGLLIWDTGLSRMEGTYLRTDHAVQIGKPCIRCYEVE